MRYPDGQLARLRDRLRLWDGVEKAIVCSLNTDEYSAAYPRSEWDCLKTGVLVHSAQTGRHVEHRVPGFVSTFAILAPMRSWRPCSVPHSFNVAMDRATAAGGRSCCNPPDAVHNHLRLLKN